jgi:tripartite-type tricarboxylate transporter receptor subunit TctC
MRENRTIRETVWRRLLPMLACALTGAIAPAKFSAAQQYPSRAVRVVVAAPPGGLTDIVARSVSQFLHNRLGQPFVIENIAGASATVGAAAVARATPDGYTLLVNPSLFVINPMLMKVPYDAVKDFTAISNLGNVPLAMAVNPELPVRNLREFVAMAKASPDKLSWATDGIGSVGHLTEELLHRAANFRLLIVPYRGTAPAVIDLIAGRVHAIVTPVPNLIEYFRAGQLRPLAVTTRTRVSVLPDVPTMEELGIPGIEIGSWYGVWGPANLPRDAVSVLNREFADAMKTPSVVDRLVLQGLIPVGSNAVDFAAFINAEVEKYGRIIRDSNIKVEN